MARINQGLFLLNQMRRTSDRLEKSTHHLSSGKRITQAADDAAGMAISQKMRAQIRGLSQASQNVMDASSLVHVAEGGMKEINELLHRIRELSVQSANGTLQETDRQVIEDEIGQLKHAMSDIVHNTEFNTHKVLSNTNYEQFIEETRTQHQSIGLVESQQLRSSILTHHLENTTQLDSPVKVIGSDSVPSTSRTSIDMLHNVKGTTVLDHQPRYSTDGQSIIFQSTREAGTYFVPIDLSADSAVYQGSGPASARTTSTDGLAKLETFGTSLWLSRRSSTTGLWYTAATFTDYNFRQDGSQGFSFSPTTEDGETSFVYADTDGNIQQVQIRTQTGEILDQKNIISSADTLHIPPTVNTLSLTSAPKLYRMGESNASLKVYKETDSGRHELTYWNESGDEPPEGYYTVSGSQITFHGSAIIGEESGDDAQDYYTFSYVASSGAVDIYTKSVPSGADIYNMDGSDGPRSLDVRVGTRRVMQEDLLEERPTDPNVDGVYYNDTTDTLEFYGKWRPAHNERVRIEYLLDSTRDEAYTQRIAAGVDLYNLEDADLAKNRALRVFVAGAELHYSDTDGFSYNPDTGNVSIHGDARPDLPAGEQVKIEFFPDPSGSNADENVVKIPLSLHPEIYHLYPEEQPSSIKVFRNGTEEIAYSETNGFQYNKETNTIELYGDARPDATDNYEVKFVKDSVAIVNQNGIVEVLLGGYPELYTNEGSTEPVTIEVLVGGTAVSYDETKENGYVYHETNNTIELYGNARPAAGEQITVNYLVEATSATHGNESYELHISPPPLDYGVSDGAEPRAMRVYYKGVEVPYGDEDGFTFDPETNLVSLHGSYRPTGEDDVGDLEVVSITADMVKQSIPSGHRVHHVFLNGEQVGPADENDGDGYIVNGQTVELSGNARLNVSRDMGAVEFEVLHHLPLDFALDNSGLVYDPYEDTWNVSSIVSSEIVEDSIHVQLNGEPLDPVYYRLVDNVLHFSDHLSLIDGDNTFTSQFDLKHGTGYESNQFMFQVGAQSGQHHQVDIQSFNHVLLRSGGLTVATQERANQSIALTDQLLQFVSAERSKLGAQQNRFEVITNNLATAEENLTAAGSRIADADMAKKIMEQVKLSILQQAQQAMQAHQTEADNGVLRLLE